MSIYTADKLSIALADALGMPKQCAWFELRATPGQPVTVTCEYYPDDAAGRRAEAVLAGYEVVERTSSKPISFDEWMTRRIDAGRTQDADTMRRLSEMDRRQARALKPSIDISIANRTAEFQQAVAAMVSLA